MLTQFFKWMLLCDIFNEIDCICIYMSRIWVNLDWYDKGDFWFRQYDFSGRLTCCLQINVHSLFSFLISWKGYDPNLKVYFWNFLISYCESNFHSIIIFFIIIILAFSKLNSNFLFYNHGGKLIFLILEELNFVVVGTLSMRFLISWGHV